MTSTPGGESPLPMTSAEILELLELIEQKQQLAALLRRKAALLDAWEQSGREITKEWYDQLMYDVPEDEREALWLDKLASDDAELRPRPPPAQGTHARPVRARPDDLLALPAADHHAQHQIRAPRPRRQQPGRLPRARARILLDFSRREQGQQDQDGHARHAAMAAARKTVTHLVTVVPAEDGRTLPEDGGG